MRGTVRDRFLAKVIRDPLTGCWYWTAFVDRAGYGRLMIGGRNGTPQLAHRVSYLLHVGAIPDGLDVDHLCRIRRCVNPGHLEAVTHAENVRRSSAGQVRKRLAAAVSHCPKGHAYAGENLYVTPRGSRICRECNRESCRRSRAAKRRDTEPSVI